MVLTALALVGGGVYWFVIRDTSPATDLNKNSKPITTTEAIKATFISYTDDGFEPAEYFGVVGKSFTIQNDSYSELDFESDDHPTHTKNKEFNIGIIKPGENKTIELTKDGEWGFHNHNNSSHVGKITVVK